MTRTCAFLLVLVAVVACRSIPASAGEAFHQRVARIGDGIAAARRAAADDPVPEIRAERQRVLAGIADDWEEARRVGEGALELDQPRGLEYANDLLNGVERRLSVLPRG